MLKRICSFTVGLFIMSLGVAFSINSTLGTTPISSISYALALITNIDIGITTFLFNAALIFIQLIILKSRFEKKRLLQFINCVLFGYFTDVALYLVSFVPFEPTIPFYILYLVLSIFLIAFGIFIYMPADIAPLPGEGCVQAIAMVTDWRFSTIKIGFDATVGSIAFVMCALWYANAFAAVSIGTVISAFMVGFTLRQISNLYFRLTGERINVVSR